MNSWSPPQLPILLLDVDGVLADFVTPFLKHINEVLDSSFTEDDITEHNIEDCLGLSTEERTEVRSHIDRSRMARRQTPQPYAVDAVKRLSESAAIFFVTSSLTSSQTWEWDRRAWLDDTFGAGYGRKTLFAKDKYLVQGDIFVDDGPHNVEKWAIFNKCNQDRVPVLWDQWYNANYDVEANKIIRTNNWGYVESLVWEKTRSKNVLLTWIERNESWLAKHASQYIAVNPYTGMTLWDETLPMLQNKTEKLPHKMVKDMTIWFNAIPVDWKGGKNKTEYDL